MAHTSNLEQAVALDMEKWLQTLPEEAPAYAFSEKYNMFRVKLFDKMRGEKYHRFTKRATVAIIVAAILFAMVVATLAATLGKEFIIKHFSGYATVEVENGKEDIKSVNEISLNYIPNRFEKISDDVSDMGITFSYSNGDYWFNISKELISSNYQYDEEDNSLQTIDINGVKYLYSHSSDYNALLWNNKGYSFYIDGNISKDELIKIAQGAR